MQGKLKGNLKDLENEKLNEPVEPVKKEKVVLGNSEVKTKKKGKT